MIAKKNLHMMAWLAAAITSVFLVNNLLFAASRGFSIDVKTPTGEEKKIKLYKNSYALVIGNGTYRKGCQA
ncbi:MAG: hypothetical protein H8E81_04875 [Deltaproteobacteria bacterium]|nr:hypothetical protein [Deltaproteobacteria bacterium]